ncbi:MAG: penicillin-binding protein 1C [Flavobacteriales bacterium]|nr:penicillin-binding protein 1C [Flavobacteriales bacterium]
MKDPVPSPTLRITILITSAFWISVGLSLWIWGGLTQLPQRPQATLVTDSLDQVLGGHVSIHGEWYFLSRERTLPRRLSACITTFEDRRFDLHFGVDIPALAAALWGRITGKGPQRGGSALTMQLARMEMHGNQPRTLGRKILEMIKALAIEWRYSKEDILKFWSDHAPFGGNVAGVEAASWRYFEKAPADLSWAEAAMLAVLPNKPGLLHPGRNIGLLKKRRDFLLNQLFSRGLLTSSEFRLALEEPLPEAPRPLPALAPHLAAHPGKGVMHTTLSAALQEQVMRMAEMHGLRLKTAGVNHLGVLVAETSTGRVVAYVGNNPLAAGEAQGDVDVLKAPRSYGSLFKPFLYAASLQQGLFLPQTLIPDHPMAFSGYAPRNFDYTFQGAVPADRSVSRSLNVPSVWMLKNYGTARFLNLLREAGIHHLNKPADYYGLSLILGGGESTPWEVASLFVKAGQRLSGRDSVTEEIFLQKPGPGTQKLSPQFPGPAALWCMTEAMGRVNLPDVFAFRMADEQAGRIAWKTGTSYGHRDGWAAALTPGYTLVVWTGNADGTGRFGLTGLHTAAPLLWDVLACLPPQSPFSMPVKDMTETEICQESGYRQGPYCPHGRLQLIPKSGKKTPQCPFHKPILLDRATGQRVLEDCRDEKDVVTQILFDLPPLMAHYFFSAHPEYSAPPSWDPQCLPADEESQPIRLVTPMNPRGLIPEKDAMGMPLPIVFEAVQPQSGRRLWWFLNSRLLGFTEAPHKMNLRLDQGRHVLVLADENGHFLSQDIFVR